MMIRAATVESKLQSVSAVASRPTAFESKMVHGPKKADHVIEVLNVSKTYDAGDSRVQALRDVSFNVRKGEFVSIVGRSGCGKSTLLNLIAGLDIPSIGSVSLDGIPIAEPSAKVGFVFQRAVLLEWRTVTQNILLPVEILRLDVEEYRDRAKELIDLIGLTGFEDRYPRQLSGGMQQRVALARSLIYDPDILLMDEPFGALDAITREQMDLELLRIWEASGKTVIFVTHDIAEAVFLSDRVILMTPRPGRIKEIVPVPIERPRTLRSVFVPEFAEVRQRIREQMD
jgi:NitT/TauT family transport system ATP-binding protein